MSAEKKAMIKDFIKITKHNLVEEVNEFKKLDRNLVKDWSKKGNARLN